MTSDMQNEVRLTLTTDDAIMWHEFTRNHEEFYDFWFIVEMFALILDKSILLKSDPLRG